MHQAAPRVPHLVDQSFDARAKIGVNRRDVAIKRVDSQLNENLPVVKFPCDGRLSLCACVEGRQIAGQAQGDLGSRAARKKFFFPDDVPRVGGLHAEQKVFAVLEQNAGDGGARGAGGPEPT